MPKLLTALHIALLLLGIGIVLHSGSQIYRSKQTTQWPQTRASITSSEVCSNALGKFSYAFWPCVTYQYHVEGMAFQGNTIKPRGTQSIPKQDAQEIVARYPKGATVPLFYNPSDAKVSYLEPDDTNWFNYLLMTLGLGIVAGSSALIKLSRRPDTADN